MNRETHQANEKKRIQIKAKGCSDKILCILKNPVHPVYFPSRLLCASASLREITLLLSLIGLVGLAGCGKGGAAGGESADKGDEGASAPVAVEMATPTVQAVEITVGAQGTLAAAQGANVRVAAPFAGRLTAVYAREGDQVRQGQRLALVDNRPQQAQARSAQVAVRVAQVQARGSQLAAQAAGVDQSGAVRTNRLALDAAVLDQRTQVRQAQNALDTAQTDLTRIRAGARPQEIAQADQAIAQAQATQSRAQTERDRVQFLFDKGVAPRRQLDDALTAFTVANSGLTSAQQAASLLRAGARAEEVRAGELRVEGARDALNAAQRSGEAKILQARAALQQAQQSRLNVAVKQEEALAMQDMTAQKQADLAAAQATANYAELRAPISGTVTRRAANVGDMADPAVPILEISDPRALNLVASLTAEDGLQVRVGMPAHVTLADMPGKTFAGRVLSIGQVDPQSNLMSVRLAVGGGSGLRAGAFASADIVLRRIAGAIVVPKSAIVTQDGKQVAYTVGKDNVAHLKPVKVGPELGGGKMVAILSGLDKDEPVVSVGNYELSEGAKVKTGDAEGADKDEKKDDKKDAEKSGDKSGDKKDAEARSDTKSDAKPDEAKGAAKAGVDKETPTSAEKDAVHTPGTPDAGRTAGKADKP